MEQLLSFLQDEVDPPPTLSYPRHPSSTANPPNMGSHSQPKEAGLHMFLHGTTKLLVTAASVIHVFGGKTPWLIQPSKGITAACYRMEQARGERRQETRTATKFSQYSHHFRGQGRSNAKVFLSSATSTYWTS